MNQQDSEYIHDNRWVPLNTVQNVYQRASGCDALTTSGLCEKNLDETLFSTTNSFTRNHPEVNQKLH